MTERFDVIVIGGGVIGLATLDHLATRTPGRLALVEAHALGHRLGSSHGRSRVSRSLYPAATYRRLMAGATGEDWPALEGRLGRRLRHPNVACFSGPPGAALDAYASALAEAGEGDGLEALTVGEARRRWPLALPDSERVLVDRTAAIVDAEATVDGLGRRAQDVAKVVTGRRVVAVEPAPDGITVVTEPGPRLVAGRVVITAGAWTARLVPRLAEHLTVIRQTVAVFEEPDADLAALPIWIRLGRNDDKFYGLRELGGGLKIARHEVRGRHDDPDRPAGAGSTAVARLRFELERELGRPVGPVRDAFTCLYTCTASEDYVLDLLPDEPRIAVGAGFSGHGFKFAPTVGRILAGLILDGTSDVPAFESDRARFAIA